MKDYPTIIVAPVRQGKPILSPSQRKRLAAAFQRRDGGEVRIEIRQRTKARSNSQNRYMWGVVYEILASETGHTQEEVHEYMKATFLPREFITLGDKEQQLVKSTTTLSTFDMEVYLEKIRVFAATELGIRIPLPRESM
ncbi:hypothetical protein KW797_01420 [Candidatus Parcubacteria bacterium]|nr:hypothetical protein [Candidatus Parcubacteria bacterium]